LVEKDISSINSILKDIHIQIENLKEKQKKASPSLTNIDGIQFQEKLDKAQKVAKYYENITSELEAGEEGRTKMVVVDCIFTILENGIATAFPMTLLFIIFFLIFMFIPVGF